MSRSKVWRIGLRSRIIHFMSDERGNAGKPDIDVLSWAAF
jgi:hypothetical protein